MTIKQKTGMKGMFGIFNCRFDDNIKINLKKLVRLKHVCGRVEVHTEC